MSIFMRKEGVSGVSENSSTPSPNPEEKWTSPLYKKKFFTFEKTLDP
jgi:hypothetical protein